MLDFVVFPHGFVNVPTVLVALVFGALGALAVGEGARETRKRIDFFNKK